MLRYLSLIVLSLILFSCNPKGTKGVITSNTKKGSAPELDEAVKIHLTSLYIDAQREKMLGNFQDGSIAGKIQHGSGWWFLDQMDGMTRQMESLSQLGMLSRFVGMLTDSRSFLSYTRHEYFRRNLCNLLGDRMKAGMIPRDLDLAGTMVSDICYCKAKSYFRFGK